MIWSFKFLSGIAATGKRLNQAGAWLNRPFGILLLIFLPAFLAVFKYGLSGLNADILINQIMSQQNVTLFYWGQNRILNLVPFLLAPVKWPLVNLFLLLFIATSAFFGSLYLLALFCCRLSFKQIDPGRIRLAYLAMLSIAIFTFKRPAWESLCLWHFEYSLPLCFVLLNVYFYYYNNIYAGILSCSLVILALGINPAIFIFVAPAICLKIFIYSKTWYKDSILFAWYTLIMTLWVAISSAYGSYEDYSTVVLANFHSGIENLTLNLIREYLKTNHICIALLIYLTFNIYYSKYWHQFYESQNFSFTSILQAVIIICILYTCFVACIRWVQMNDYSPRYLAYDIYFGIFSIVFYLIETNRKLFIWLSRYSGFSLFLFLAVIYFLYPSTFNLSKAEIYKKCDDLVAPSANLYVGDYWLIWSCASRDLNSGYNSYVFGYRSQSNAHNIERVLASRLKSTNCLKMHCLNSEAALCRQQIEAYLPSAEITPFGNGPGNNVLNVCVKGSEHE